MRLYTSKVHELFSSVKSKKTRGLLLYGPEHGLINWIVNKLGSFFDSIEQVAINNPNELLIHLQSQDLFAKSKLLKIQYTSKLDKKSEEVLSGNYNNFPVIIAEEMPTNNSLRKIFESSSHLISIGCYPDNNRSLESFILNEVADRDKIISSAAISYIIDNCENNRLNLIRDIEKLCLYSSKNIDIQDVMAVMNQYSSHEVDELCFAFMNKDAPKYFSLLGKIKISDIQPISIIRTFIKYYNRLFIVNLHSNIDSAISELKPPIFFAHVESFRSAARKLKFEEVKNTLKNLWNLEGKIKSNDNHAYLLEELFFMSK